MKVATVSVGGERRVGQGIDNGRSIAPSISEARREALAHAEKADHRLIDCPTLIVTGDEDAVGPATVARELADKIGGARTVSCIAAGIGRRSKNRKMRDASLGIFARNSDQATRHTITAARRSKENGL